MTRLWRILPFLGIFLLSANSASASDRLPVVGPTDFWFTLDQPAQLTARAYAWEYGIDSMLWLYDEAGNLVAANDDWFGLDSWLDRTLPAGSYRVRAGVCCGDPNWWYGTSYEIEFNSTPVEPTTTTTTTVPETTTTVEETTTTVEETTTTVEETTTTVEETTTTSEQPSTTLETTTTEQTTSTTPEETWPPTTSVPATPPKTTTSSSSTTSTTSSTTSTSTTTSTVPPTTELATTLPATTSPQTTVLAVTTVASTEPATVPSVSSSAPSAPETTTTTTIPQVEPELPAPPVGASEQQKRQFESQVNVFSGAYDNYVPAGSTITVAQRRTMVAATVAVSTVLPGPTSRRKK